MFENVIVEMDFIINERDNLQIKIYDTLKETFDETIDRKIPTDVLNIIFEFLEKDSFK